MPSRVFPGICTPPIGIRGSWIRYWHDEQGEYFLKNFIVKSCALLLALLPAGAVAQAGQPAFEARGRRVEAHRDSLQRHIERLRSDLLDSLRAAVPDLISRLDPASPPVAQGYQLLPQLVADAPQPTDTTRRASLYSWPWTDTLIARANRSVDQLTALLRAGRKERAVYDRLVESFNRVAADRRLIDAHVEHNWFWQRAIAADSVRFSGASAMIDSLLRGTAARATAAPAMPRVRMSLDDSGSGPTTIRVPVVTDIQDTAFVHAAQSIIEALWSGNGYRVLVDVQFITPRELYCPGSNAACAPPARGATIDLPSHVARFPIDRAVLTTGGTQPHVLGGRALILGPRDLPGRTLGHEFGHLLGFDDAYLRGYRSLGPDGYAVVELIPDRNDIMAASGFGSVQPRHFQQFVANLRSDRAMKAGLHAFYERRDPHTAVGLFAAALSNRPDHYGATFQLAKALDQSGDSAAANPVWRRMLDMARAAGDSATAAIAASRLRVP